MISPDFYLPALCISATLLTVADSYYFGGEAVRRLHTIEYSDTSGRARRVPGWVGEVLVWSLIITGLALTAFMVPQPVVTQTQWIKPVIGSAYVISLIFVHVSAGAQIAKTKDDDSLPGFMDQVKRSYRFYICHAAMVFTTAFYIAVKLLAYLYVSWSGITTKTDAFVAKLAAFHQGLGPVVDDQALIALSGLALEFRALTSAVTGQLEPFLALTLLAVLVNVLMISTPVWRAFRHGAIVVARDLTVAAVLTTFAVAAAAFFFEFRAITLPYAALLNQAATLAPETLDGAGMLADLVGEARGASGVSGFLRAAFADGGLVVVIIAAIQLLVPKLLAKIRSRQ